MCIHACNAFFLFLRFRPIGVVQDRVEAKDVFYGDEPLREFERQTAECRQSLHRITTLIRHGMKFMHSLID